ncbi:unnamed protein product [Cunninghamella echinulata]
MNELPNKLIQHILSFLPQRYVAVASLVCKEWLLATRHERFYQIIYIYSENQLKKFLDITTTLKITKNNIPVGQLVYEINVDIITHYNSFICNKNILGQLYNCCPNLTKIVGLKLNVSAKVNAYHYWPYLTTIPLWYSSTNLSLSFHKQHDIITSLEYMVKLYNITAHNEGFYNTPAYNLGLYNTTTPYVDYFAKTGYENNDGIIQVQKDQQQRTRSKKHHPNPNHGVQLANDQEFILHYGKSIFFSTPSSWTQLIKLSLQFCRFTGNNPTWIYELDERVFNTINSTCPHLESLALYDFYMNLSDDYLSALATTATKINKVIHLHSSLKQLHFNSCAFHDNQCFDYVSKLYPNITDLKLDLIWNRDGMEECKQYKLSLFNMITGFTRLKKLSAALKSIKNNNTFLLMEHTWPTIELYEWFIDHPTQLEVLDYPYDLLGVEDFYLTHLQSKSQSLSSPSSSSLLNYQYGHNLNHSLAYLRHLTTLTLRLQADPLDLLQYLRMDGCSTSVSLSITSLKIVGDAKHNWVSIYEKSFRYNDNDFFICQWLDAFPNVKKLDLTEVGSIKKEKIKRKRKRKRGDNDQQQLKQLQQQKSYVLEELYIQRVYFHMNDDQLRELFASCPSLHTLSLSYINFVYPSTKPTLPSFSPPFKHKNNWNFIIFDMPHLHLDKLELLYIKSKACIEKSYGNKPCKLIVNEFTSTNSFELEKTQTLLPSLCMIVNCKSVDILRFENSAW